MSQRKISTLARSQAVENFTSSEQLDQRLIVVRSKSWLLLALGVAAIAAAVTWGILGRVPTVVDGEGIVAPQDTWPVEIDSSYAYGSVEKMLVAEGDEVEVDDQIIRLHNPDLEKALENLKSQLQTLKDEDTRLNTAEDRIIKLEKRSLDAQIANATQILEQTKKLVTMLQQESDSLAGLVKDQLIPRTELVQTRSALFSSMQQLTQQESVMAAARAEHDSLINTTEKARIERARGIDSLENRIAAETIRLTTSTEVLAPIAGTIIDHAIDVGSSVQTGTLVSRIRPHAPPGKTSIRAKAFVPYGKGKQIRSGMGVQLSLPFAKPSRYGYVLGKVIEVNQYVAGLTTDINIGSTILAENIERAIGPMLEITVELELDPKTPTGLRWTSQDGFPEKLDYPLFCGVRVITRENRPIDLVIPWLKDRLGLDPRPTVQPTGTEG